jgi:hypothetical protein
MIDSSPAGDGEPEVRQALALTVGARFGLESMQSAVSILQVAPFPEAGISIDVERWETNAEHHGYVDHYGNRCERFELAAGGSASRS